MTYQELRDSQQARVNDFLNKYAFFAFNDDQFAEGVKKLGVEDLTQLVRIYGGGFLLRDKSKDYKELSESLSDELEEFMTDPENAYQAFIAELSNHEYNITGDPEETLDALGLSVEDLAQSETLSEAFKRATRVFL